MDMKKQQNEWAEAQKIEMSVDLVVAAKQHLKFLAAVDGNGCLYEGPALERAIYRYHAFWLPLLAKHSECPMIEGPLVAPLDCEWVWHCHRLNPAQYQVDCETLYGRILDTSNVVSSVQENDRTRTEELWARLYPEETYELDVDAANGEDMMGKLSKLEKLSKYNFVSAVKRQSTFFSKVAHPHMYHDLFLEEAVARYKGFLHLIKREMEKSIEFGYVPTLDIDLIWHTHQLHPVSYSKDLNMLFDEVLQHDDDVSDDSKGKELDDGFSITKDKWEETFGVMYRGDGAKHGEIWNNKLQGSTVKNGSRLTTTECNDECVGDESADMVKGRPICLAVCIITGGCRDVKLGKDENLKSHGKMLIKSDGNLHGSTMKSLATSILNGEYGDMKESGDNFKLPRNMIKSEGQLHGSTAAKGGNLCILNGGYGDMKESDNNLQLHGSVVKSDCHLHGNAMLKGCNLCLATCILNGECGNKGSVIKVATA